MRRAIVPLVLAMALLGPAIASAQVGGAQLPALNDLPRSVGFSPTSLMDDPQEVALGLKILGLLTVLSLVPSILMMVTCFTRIIVVLAFVRRALGVNEVPPTSVLMALALFLTFFVMAPLISEMNEDALQPYMREEISGSEALDTAQGPLREFMLEQTRRRDLALFIRLSQMPAPETPDDLPLHVLIPAFMISELKTAFTIGFMLYIPFLIIDMVVSSILLSMGMLMLPPILISLPFKVILFVLVDGWNLIVGSLLASYF